MKQIKGIWCCNIAVYICISFFIFSCIKTKEWNADVPFTLSSAQVSEVEKNIDHAGLIQGLNDESFKRGAKIYQNVCHNCHGNMKDEGSLPTAHKFWSQKFKVGNDPYSMYQTLTRGFATMPPQVDLVPQEKYDVIQYIREEFIKENNLGEYYTTDDNYLESIPKGVSKGPEAKEFAPWSAMDYGDFLINTYELVNENSPKREMSSGKAPLADEDFLNANMAYKGIAIRLNDGEGGVSAGNAWTVFDHDLFRVAGGWTGEGFVDWNGILLNGRHNISPRTVGKLQYSNAVGPGWANPETGSFKDPRFQARDGRKFGPLPRKWGKYKGLYQYEGRTIVSYSIGTSNVLEGFGIENFEGNSIFTRTLNVQNVKNKLKLRIAPNNVKVALVGSQGNLIDEDGYTVLVLSKAKEIKLKVLISKELNTLDNYAKNSTTPESLNKFMNGGKPQYPDELTTRIGQLNTEGPFLVDVLTAPKHNKWKSRLRMSGIDFLDDPNEAVVCCSEGDVWLIKGLENGSELTWKRIATGLFQPLGIKVIDKEIYVTCRDQIVILRDLNKDGETDFYESFNSDHQVTDHFHEFAMGLQTDKAGNLYYAKSGRHAREALVPQHGTLLKVSKDGEKTDIIAHGFRAANGVCLNPDGSFLVTDQEGHWNPMNRINWVDKNGFYGNMFGYNPPADSSDKAMIPPMAWVDKKLDRSPSELVWVDSDKWGPFSGSLLNLSYGYGNVFLVPHEKVNGQMQGSFFQLPIPTFPTGVMRGRFHPKDGQLYACGMSAWGTQQMTEPGGLYRVRYNNEPVLAPLKVNATKKGMKLVFANKLDKNSAENLKNYAVKTWGLKRNENYGSKHYNEKEVKVEKAVLSEDGKTLMLSIKGMKPVWQMEINFTLKDEKGKKSQGKIHSTIHNLGS